MDKTKLTQLGINPAFYALLAYVFAAFDSRLMVLGLLLFVIAAERDMWVTKHVVQALVLTYIFTLVWAIIGLVPVYQVTAWIGSEFSYEVAKVLNSIYSGFLTIIQFIIYAFYAFVAVAAVKGKAAKLPLVHLALNLLEGKKKESTKKTEEETED